MVAKFNTVGLNELQREIARRASLLDDAAPEMLKAGTDILVEYQRGAIIEKELIDSGDMLDSIAAGKLQEIQDGYYQEVWPQGTDHKGVRNAHKGFILEYGTSTSDRKKEKEHKGRKRNIRGTNWMDEANTAAKEEVIDAMRQVWNGYVERE